MSPALTDIDTIVIVMLENRSFDHLLGHLSYPPNGNRPDVDGIRLPLNQQAYRNLFATESYYPFLMRDGDLPADLPHERAAVSEQLAFSSVTGKYDMSGFVSAYYKSTPVNRTLTPETMGFLAADQVTISDFLAREYVVCDRWFAPIPTSTQPNRIMSLTGTTMVDKTESTIVPIGAGTFVLDWLDLHRVRWRVYNTSVVSFFLAIGRFLDVIGPNFHDVSKLAGDFAGPRAAGDPQVVFIEPCYSDAPFLGIEPNDEHAPRPVTQGERFLHDVYEALTANPKRWAKTLLIVTYDEHGGFFDHVPPLPIRFTPPPGARFTAGFESTGPRVPGLIVSPFAARAGVCQSPFDHTSILQLLAEKFTPGAPYSPEVDNRRVQGIRSLSEALSDVPRADIPLAPASPAPTTGAAGPYKQAVAPSPPPPARGPTANELAFRDASIQFLQKVPEAAARFPELAEWRTKLPP
ncbi:MAG TPA: alkaline phosphatase family protein [Gemmatimonadales bacterium]|jgi:phospholipase C